MRNFLGILLTCGAMLGCTNPKVQVVELPNDASANGIRVRRVTPYTMSVYAVDASRQLVLKDGQTANLPDANEVYVINYNGAVTSSSLFKVTLHENGSLDTVHVETTRTLKAAAEAAQALTEQALKARQAQKEAEAEKKKLPQQKLLEQIKAIKEYRTEYGGAIALPAVPGEPLLPDGSALSSQ
jgi:hypothetical protein